MPWELVVLGIITLIELGLWYGHLWKVRRLIASFLVPALAMDSGLIAGAHFSLWAIILLIFGLYRIINLLRVVEGRTNAAYLFIVARRSSLSLVGLQVIVLALARLNHVAHFADVSWLYLLVLAQITLATVLLTTTVRQLRTTRPPTHLENYADRDLPSLSVCIPARNETDDLEACLQSLTVSTYPKLEILVLDDCSQNKRTPAIIRAFAQDGVRFVDGAVPPEHWLAKNYAYQQLVKAASGEFILFCGVDTRFQPDSLSVMVETMLYKHKMLLSIIPRNQLPKPLDLLPVLVQPSRYAWELSLPRRWLKRPPVLSTCWLIAAETLRTAGGFEAIQRAHSPESFFARYASSHNDSYSFMQSDRRIGLVSTKGFAEQRATAARTRYPQTHRRPEVVALLTMAELAFLLAPFGLVVGAVWELAWPLAVLSAIACAELVAVYSLVTALTYRQFLMKGFWLLPLAAIFDVSLLNYSLWRYEFREVIWKGRNICVPLMHVVGELPKS